MSITNFCWLFLAISLYLHDREQMSVIDDNSSNYASITSRVPQAIIIGPFIHFCLVENVEFRNSYLHADDTHTHSTEI